MKSAIQHVVRHGRLIREYLYDYGRMARYSSAVRRGDSREKLKALIIMYYHGLEKGLSLPQPRPGFGREKVEKLMGMLREYVHAYGTDGMVLTALNALQAYLEFNAQARVPNNNIREEVDRLTLLAAKCSSDGGDTSGGCKRVTLPQLREAAQASFEQFSQARYSVRQFSERPVELETIHDAVRIAQRTPSVCNRQPWKVWIVGEADSIGRILSIGGGAEGFGDQIRSLLVVTSDLSCFQSPGERNQCWIDGGMFGMSLIYALHAKGLASCCMNWSKTRADDVHLRRLMGLPGSQSIIVLLGVGYPRDEFVVATSARKPLDEVLFHWQASRDSTQSNLASISHKQ